MQINSIQEWLESFGEPVAETAFPPRDKKGNPNRISAPYIVYLDNADVDGSDDCNLFTSHDLTIERYSKDGNNARFDSFLWRSGLHFSRSKKWLSSEQLYMTVYNIKEEIIIKNGVDQNGNGCQS